MGDGENPRERRWWLIGYTVIIIIVGIGALRQLLKLFE